MALNQRNLQGIVGWERFFQSLSTFLESNERRFASASEEYIEHAIDRLGIFIRSVTHLLDVICTAGTAPERIRSFTDDERDSLEQFKQELETLLEHLRALYVAWDNRYDAIHVPSSSRFILSRRQSRERGRPRFNITQEQLEYLISLSFSFTRIASMLSVSRMTIYRRCQEYNITTNGHTPDDGELRRLIGDVRRNFPDIGKGW